MRIKVRERGQTVELSGRAVDTIIRRVYGRKAGLMGTAIVGPRTSGGYPVLAELVSVDGIYVRRH